MAVPLEVERMDAAVAEVTDQQVLAEASEAVGRPRNPPRRIEHSAGGNAADEVAGEIELIDEPVPGPRNVVITILLAQRIRDEDGIAEHLDPEWRIALGEPPVLEAALHLGPLAVVHIDGACVEIGRIEPGAFRGHGNREAFVDGAERTVVYEHEGIGPGGGGVPAADGSGFGREHEE